MHITFRQVAGAITSTFILLLSFSVPVYGQEADPPTLAPTEARTALEISPSLDNIVAIPGDVIQREMTVKNLADIPLPIKAYTRSFVATDEFGGSDYPDDVSNAAAQHWFGLDTPDFILQPGASKTLKITISVPDRAEPGGHYATLFVESLVPKEVLSASSLYLATRVGALYFFVVAGDVQEKGSVEKVELNSFYQHGPVIMTMTFKNEGNVHLQPVSKVTVKNWRGKVVYETKDSGKVTLPRKTRNWEIVWDQGFLFGRYTVEIDSDIARDRPHQLNKKVFWAAPVIPLSAILIALILFIWIIRVGRGRFRKALRALRG